MRLANSTTPTFEGSAGSGLGPSAKPATAERLNIFDDAGSVIGYFNKSVAGDVTLVLNGAEVVTSQDSTLSAALSSDDSYSGSVITGLNNSGGVTQWDSVYLNSSSQWVIADANGSGTYPARGMAVATVADGEATSVLVHGTVRNDGWNWTIGGSLYLSATAGGLTQTAPSTSGDKVQVVGFALTADIAFFDFNSVYLTVS